MFLTLYIQNDLLQFIALYIINHLIITAIMAFVRLKNYRRIYGGNTTLFLCIKRRILKGLTFFYSILATIAEAYLFS